MDSHAYARVNRTQVNETFLMAVTAESSKPDIRALLISLLADRNPFHIVRRGTMTVLARQDVAFDVLDMLVNNMGKHKAVVGCHNEKFYIAVSFPPERLCACLLRSVEALRSIRAPVRPIQTVYELLNCPPPIRKRPYEDD